MAVPRLVVLFIRHRGETVAMLRRIERERTELELRALGLSEAEAKRSLAEVDELTGGR